jgi:hypothetical protein
MVTIYKSRKNQVEGEAGIGLTEMLRVLVEAIKGELQLP